MVFVLFSSYKSVPRSRRRWYGVLTATDQGKLAQFGLSSCPF